MRKRSSPMVADRPDERVARTRAPTRRVRGGEDGAVGFNFVTADRDQSFVMPPDMRDRGRLR